jgi:hypothetical protein
MRIDSAIITGSFSVNGDTFNDLGVFPSTGSNTFVGNQSIVGAVSASALTGSINYTNLTDVPTLVSGSEQIVGILSSLNLFTSSATARLNSIETITSSNIARINALETTSASVDTLNTTQNTRLSNLEIKTGSLATTGSNTFIGTQTITGSLYISSDLIVQGSSSLQNITASAVSIGTNIVNLNTANPAIRYAGLSIGDSGSIGSSGSFLYDSVQDEMIFVHRGANTTVTSSVVLMGPQTYDSIGSEIYPTLNRIQKGSGNEHLVDSNITATANDVTITNTIDAPMFILENINSSSYSQIQFKGDTRQAYIFKGNSTYTSYGGTNALNFYTDSGAGAGGFAFHPSNIVNAVFIDNAGNLGIGVGTTVGSKVDVSGGNVRVTSSQNGFGGVQAINPSNGTSAYGGLLVGNNGATTAGGFLMLGGNYPTTGPYTSDGAYAFSNRAGGITIAAEVGTIKFVTGATIKGTMLANGNLGLNTTDPTNLLHLAGASATPSLRLGSVSVGYHWDIGRENATTGDFLINYTANGTFAGTFARITTAGLFGIGVTASGTYGKLSVAGGIRTIDDNNSKLELGRYSSANPYSYLKIGTNATSLNITNAADSADLFYFTNGGRLGIGISPTTILDVVGSNGGNALTYMQNTNTAGYSGIDFFRQGGVHAGSAWVANDSAGATNNRNALTIAARVAGEKLILVGGGYDPTIVGGLTITGANTKLEGNNAYHMINSTAGLYSYIFLNNQAGGAGNDRTAYFIQNTAGQTSNGVAAGAAYMYFGQSQNMEFSWAGTTKVTFTSAGAGTFVGGVTSDRRTKENISLITNSTLSFINELKPVSYQYISDKTKKTRRGFIAQDVLETSIPSLVLGDGEIDGGTYGLDYDGILALAVKAIQELKAEIEVLKNK